MTLTAYIARAEILAVTLCLAFCPSAAAQVPTVVVWPRQDHAAAPTRHEAPILLQAGEERRFTLVPNGATRRQVLALLFAGRGVAIQWRNKAFGDEKIHGRFSGTLSEIARRLLAHRSHIIVYDTRSERARVERIYILGPDPPEASGGPGARSTPKSATR